MIISSLEKMESIVKNNKSLRWDGWNVVELIASQDAMFETNGVFINGTWYMKKLYPCNTNGWKIPQKYVR